MLPARCSPGQYGAIACTDAFIAKVSPDGTELLYASFLGGSREEFGNAIAVDRGGTVYLAGETYSDDFPVTANAFQSRFGGSADVTDSSRSYTAGGDAFVAALNISQKELIFSTYLGGSEVDYASSAILADGDAFYVTGTTASSDFPAARNASQPMISGGSWFRSGDGFVAKFESGGRPSYVTYLGTPASEVVHGAGFAAHNGNLYVLRGDYDRSFCRPGVSVLELDSRDGRILDTRMVPNLWGPRATVAVDGAGVVHVLGTAVLDGNPVAVTRASAGNVLLQRLDFRLKDELAVTCIANAASLAVYRPGASPLAIARGELIAIFGEGIDSRTTVELNRRKLDVMAAGPGQVYASVPISAELGDAVLTIARGDMHVSYSIQVVSVFAGIFTVDGQHAAALNEDGTANSRENPAAPGSIVSLYATGLGTLDGGDGTTGRLEANIEAPGFTPMEILYAGPAPEMPAGVYQVNARMPANVKTGEPLVRLDFLAPTFDRSQEGVRIFVR
jgi:uncharacterized protein (TIGR03437 family)